MSGPVLASGIVLANLLYPLGALVAIVILSLAVTLRHRKPKSVEANMASFNKGLRALAPDAEPDRRRGRRAAPAPTPPPVRPVQTVLPRGRRVVRPEQLRPSDRGPTGGAGSSPSGPSPHTHHDREAETG